MLKLLKTEWLKIKRYPAFWWVMGLTALSYPGVTFIFHSIYDEVLSKDTPAAKVTKALVGNPFSFPEAWHTVAYSSSLFVFIPAVVIIMLITNEYNFKTHRQNIIDGWSRSDFMKAKLMDIFIITMLITLLYIAVSVVIGITNSGNNVGNPMQMSYYAGLFALQTISQLSLAFFVGFLVRRAFIALGVFIFYFLILENYLVYLGKRHANDIGKFLPLEVSDRLIPIPAFFGKFDKESYEKALASVNYHIVYTIVFTIILWWICFAINNKRDL